MERNPYDIHVEANPYQIELAGSGANSGNTGQHLQAPSSNEYVASGNSSGSRFNMPSRASISRQGRQLVKGVKDRGGCRLAIALFGVLVCWLTSLQVANSFVQVLFTPVGGQSPEVQQSWENWGRQINLERQRNIACVNASISTCDAVLNVNFQAMGYEADIAATMNGYLVGNATQLQQTCADKQSAKLTAIQKFKAALDLAGKPVLWTNSCDTQTDTNLNNLYTNPDLSANQATTATTQYGNSNVVTWQMAYQSMQARAAYDQQYWANKTQELEDWYTSQGLQVHPPSMPNFTTDFTGFNADLSTYWACATLSNTPPCPYSGSLYASANSTLAAFNSKYASLTSTIQQQQLQGQLFINATQLQYQDYKSYATGINTRLQDFKAQLQALNCGGCQNAVLANLPLNPPNYDSDLCFGAPNLYSYTLGAAPSINLTSLMNGLSFGNQTAAIQAKLAAMQNQVNAGVTNFGDQLSANIGSTFQWNASFGVDVGYNPPPVNVDVSNVTNLTDAYVASTNKQLADAAAKISFGGGSSSNTSFAETIKNANIKNSISSADYSYQSLDGNIDLSIWFISMKWTKFILYFLDYAWRVYYSGRIFIRYWFGAAGTMPPIDIRSYRTQKSTPLNVRIARYATHPLVLFSSAIIVACLVVSAIIGVYIPILNEYIDGCVKTDAIGQSSFLSSNVYAAGFNAAVLQGNRDLSSGLGDYDTSRANLCGSSQQDATDNYANQQHQLKIVRDNMQTVANLLGAMEQCTSMATWDSLLPGQSFTAITTNVHPTGTYHISGCAMSDFDNLGFLVPPPINCSALPSCDTGCGVDNSVIQQASHRASCETEWYVHSTILQAVCTIIVFIFWNICRHLMLEGLVRIYWKHLVRGSGLNFYSTCNKEGQIDTDTEEQLAVAIRESDASYRRWGYVYLAMSLLLNIPYIVFCVLLNIDITYPY